MLKLKQQEKTTEHFFMPERKVGHHGSAGSANEMWPRDHRFKTAFCIRNYV